MAGDDLPADGSPGKGFALVAVEFDWPDCFRVSCSVTGVSVAAKDPLGVLVGFDRWPTVSPRVVAS